MTIAELIRRLTEVQKKYGSNCIISTEPEESAYDNSIMVWQPTESGIDMRVADIEWDFN